MGEAAKRVSVSIPARVHRALRKKAAILDCSISELVTEAVRSSLGEDAVDREAARRRSGEKSQPFDTVVRSMRRRGRL